MGAVPHEDEKLSQQVQEGKLHVTRYCHSGCRWFFELVKVKDINHKSGEGAAMCPFYDEIDNILGTRAASNPVQLIESVPGSIESVPQEIVLGKLNHVKLHLKIVLAIPCQLQMMVNLWLLYNKEV